MHPAIASGRKAYGKWELFANQVADDVEGQLRIVFLPIGKGCGVGLIHQHVRHAPWRRL